VSKIPIGIRKSSQGPENVRGGATVVPVIMVNELVREPRVHFERLKLVVFIIAVESATTPTVPPVLDGRVVIIHRDLDGSLHPTGTGHL
jgi:hypothetical protein